MAEQKNYITPEGMKKLCDELTWLATKERPKVCRGVADAAAEGDRSENAEYIYGKRRLREIDRRMHFLQKRIDNAQVVDPKQQRKDKIFFGATVTVEDDEGEEFVYQIVGEDETDAKLGRISWKSPVGRALIGKEIDDTVIIRVTTKDDESVRELTVLEIVYR